MTTPFWADGEPCSHAKHNAVMAASGAHADLGYRPLNTASYIIFEEDGVYYRRDGINGEVDDSESNLTTLISNAIGDITGGGKIFLNLLAGTLPTPIQLDGTKEITLQGLGINTTCLTTTGNYNGIQFANTSQQNWYSDIRDLRVNAATGSTGTGIDLQRAFNTRLERVSVTNFTGAGGIGIRIYGVTDGAFYNKIVDCHLNNNETGLEINGATAANENQIRGTRFKANTDYGVDIVSGGTQTFHECQFEGTTDKLARVATEGNRFISCRFDNGTTYLMEFTAASSYNTVFDGSFDDVTKVSDSGTKNLIMVHGNDYSNVPKHLWFPAGAWVEVAGATKTVIGRHGEVILCDANNEEAKGHFDIPYDFRTLTKAELVVVGSVTNATSDIDIYTEWGKEGEDYNGATDSDAASTYAVTQNKVHRLDISGVFTGVAASDTGGIQVVVKGAGTTGIYIKGLFIEYINW